MSARITMADVARRANVHVSTVSMALRNHPHIAGSTKDRIKALALEMGFRPDPALSALAAYRHNAAGRRHATPIAYITHWPTRWGWKAVSAHARCFAGAVAQAEKQGYALEHFWLGEPNLTHRRLNDILMARGIRALLFAAQSGQIDVEINFDWPNFAAVKIDFAPSRPQLHVVTNDPRASVQLAIQRLRNAGYRRPGLVLPASWDLHNNFGWSAGFLAEQLRLPAEDRIPVLLFEHERELDEPGTATNPLVPRELFRTWLEDYQPDVIVSHAPCVAQHLAEPGSGDLYGIPFVDMCLLTGDGSTAGVRHNCERVGELAVETVTGLMERNIFGPPEFPTVTYVEGTWVAGDSLPAASCTQYATR